jgi:hypothetical protein
MKKISLLLMVYLVALTNCFSQKNDRKGFASINLGFSIPTGNFGSKDFTDNNAGYAATGIVSQITFGYKFHPNIGILGISQGQVNAVNVGDYAQDLANYYGASNPSGNTSVAVESSVYSLSGMMAGLFGSFHITKKLNFEPRFLIGFSTATRPKMTIETYDGGTKLTTFIDEQASALTISYMLGAGAKFDLSDKICLLSNIDFNAAKAYWKNVQSISIGHITDIIEMEKFDHQQKFRAINISIGVGFRF